MRQTPRRNRARRRCCGSLLQDRDVALHGERRACPARCSASASSERLGRVVGDVTGVAVHRLLSCLPRSGGGRQCQCRSSCSAKERFAARARPWYASCLENPSRARGRMKDILDKLEQRRAKARAGRRRGAHRGAAQARQADRARARRAAARQGLVRGVRHVRRAPLHRFRHGEDQNPRRRRGHRLGHGQRPHRVRVRQGFHRVRRLAVGDPRAEDHQGAGHGA